MRGNEIVDLLHFFPQVKTHFLGVYSLDQLKNIKFKAWQAAIINLEPSYLEGSHWFTVICTGKERFELTDSLGTTRQFVNRFFNKCEFNKTILQPLNSHSCGLFCCYTIVERFSQGRKLPFSQFINEIFTSDRVSNESKIIDFFQSWMKLYQLQK